MTDMQDPRHEHLRFSLALHHASTVQEANSCLSPYSIASALGLVSKAARGTTAVELVRLLAGEDADVAQQAELLRSAAELSADGAEEAPVLRVSNTLWVWDQLPIHDGFRTELAGWPGAGVATAPFVADPDGARQLINHDVAETTSGLIPELLQPASVDADTVASIVNALYLRTSWSLPFTHANTAEADFHAPSGPRAVPMMNQTERLGYTAHAGWQSVTLPARGGVQAVVLLPDGELTEQEATLDHGLLSELLNGPRAELVRLSMPRLDVDVRCELASTLNTLGVRTMFTPAADLGSLTEDPRLLISEVMHQAVLRIDEGGLEGAAATAAMMRLVSMPVGEPVTVRVDRPFLLLVRHPGSGAVYFFARVLEP